LEENAEIYLRLVGPNSARNSTDLIYDTLARLKPLPLFGHSLKDRELQTIGYCYIIEGKYICIYRMLADTVYVYHIVHGTSNYPNLFTRLLKEKN
jgi:plasmid stabilization system protein ParE